jgi:hypothetical protein
MDPFILAFVTGPAEDLVIRRHGGAKGRTFVALVPITSGHSSDFVIFMRGGGGSRRRHPTTSLVVVST